MSGTRTWFYQVERPSWGNSADATPRLARKPGSSEAPARVRVPQRSASVQAPSAGRAGAEQKRPEQRDSERLQAGKQLLERQEAELRKKRAEEARQRIQEQLQRGFPRTLNRSCSFQSQRPADSAPVSPRRVRSPSRYVSTASTGSMRMSRNGLATSRGAFEHPSREEVRRCLEEERKRLEEDRQRREAELEAEREAERQRKEAEQKRLQAEASSRRIAAATNEWYNVLNLPQTACVDEVKRAFRELALLHHPDKSFETCDDTFKRVQLAYQQGLRLARPAGCHKPQTSSNPKAPFSSSGTFKPPDRVPVVEKDGRKKPQKFVLLTGSADRTVRVWDMDTFECERTIWAHTKGVVSLSTTSDGDHFVTGSWDRTAKIWSLKDGTCQMTIQPNYGHRTTSMMVKTCFTLDGSEIAMVAQDSAVRIWSAETGECRMTLRGHTCDAKCACFSPDGGLLISGSIDHTARIWNADTGKLEHVLRGHQGTIVAASFASDSIHAATASEDCSAMVWNTVIGKAVLKLRGHTNTVSSVCFSLDGYLIATGSQDGNARIWSFATGDCLQTIGPAVSRKSAVSSVAISPDARFLATGSSDHKVRVWCLKTGQCEILRKHEDAVSVVAFSKLPDE